MGICPYVKAKTKDYVAILSALRVILPSVSVRSVTSDFARSLWHAVSDPTWIHVSLNPDGLLQNPVVGFRT